MESVNPQCPQTIFRVVEFLPLFSLLSKPVRGIRDTCLKTTKRMMRMKRMMKRRIETVIGILFRLSSFVFCLPFCCLLKRVAFVERLEREKERRKMRRRRKERRKEPLSLVDEMALGHPFCFQRMRTEKEMKIVDLEKEKKRKKERKKEKEKEKIWGPFLCRHVFLFSSLVPLPLAQRIRL